MKNMTLEQKRSIRGVLFISPFIIGFLVFYVRSLVMTVQFSLSNVIRTPGEAGYTLEWAGLKNFHEALFVNSNFNQELVSSVGNMIIDVALIIFFSLFMALILNQKFKGRTLVRAIFFLPVILNSDAIAGAIAMAQEMMMGGTSPMSADLVEAGSGGGVNIMYYVIMLHELGLPMGLLDYIVGAVSRINHVITASGVQMIIFIAALQSIAPSLYEVSKIEGATPYETFWKVTFPMVSPLIVTNVVYTFVDSFVSSSVVGLSRSTIFEPPFNYALGSVFGLISTAVVLVLLFAVCAIISKRTFYQN
jgi:ABC-type sugar transport system permease subunit